MEKLELEQDQIMRDIVNALKQEFAPERLFLFGSRANGTCRADSDYDFLLVVKESTATRHENMGRARQLLRNYNVNADVFVYSQDEFDEWKEELSSIPETAVNMGKEIPLGQ